MPLPTQSFTRSRTTAGFTLVEMIVAMSIFAVLGLVSSQIVSRVVDNYAVLSERGDRLTMLHRAMGIVQRDLLQVSSRTVRDTLGTERQPLVLNADGTLEFTRMGWQNPLARPRSELQRVGYRLEDEKLYRVYWLALDQAPDSEPLQQEMITEVRDLEFFIVDGTGNQHTFWPLTGAEVPELVVAPPTGGAGEGDEDGRAAIGLGSTPPTEQAVAVVMRLEIPPYGKVERIWALPSW